jgi:hypothetical protein
MSPSRLKTSSPSSPILLWLNLQYIISREIIVKLIWILFGTVLFHTLSWWRCGNVPDLSWSQWRFRPIRAAFHAICWHANKHRLTHKHIFSFWLLTWDEEAQGTFWIRECITNAVAVPLNWSPTGYRFMGIKIKLIEQKNTVGRG